jgi:hypothetical protein
VLLLYLLQELLKGLSFPAYVSDAARSLIVGLLNGNEHMRLGCSPARLADLKVRNRHLAPSYSISSSKTIRVSRLRLRASSHSNSSEGASVLVTAQCTQAATAQSLLLLISCLQYKQLTAQRSNTTSATATATTATITTAASTTNTATTACSLLLLRTHYCLCC